MTQNEHTQQKVDAAPEFSKLMLGTLLLSTKEYSSSISVFPGACAYPWFEMQAAFHMNFTLYENGKKTATFSSEQCSEEGNIRVDFDDMARAVGRPLQGMVFVELFESARIPVDVYVSAVEKKTGVYVSYPALAFMGDRIYANVHTHQLENTNFWPGVASTENTEVSVVVINPYEDPFFFQVHLIAEDGSRRQSKAIKTKPLTQVTVSLDELFTVETLRDITRGGRGTICIASQYKHIGYVMFRDRTSGIITSVDHTHNYQMV